MIEVVDRDGGLEEEVPDAETVDSCWNCANVCGNSVRTASFSAAAF